MDNTITAGMAGKMLTYKDDLKNMVDSIKEIESQVDDNLQQALLKSSCLVKLNKNLKEIDLINQALSNIIDDEEPLTKKKLLASLQLKIYESQCQLLEEIQKSIIKAVEAMTDAGSGIILIAAFDKSIKAFNKFDEKVKNTWVY